MSIIRYQSPTMNTVALSPLARLSALSNDMDRFFDLPFFGGDSQAFAGFSPALDLYQDKDTLTVKAEVPGMKKEDIHLSLHDGTLTISGERRQEKAHDEKGSLRNERFFGKFERSLTLPLQVDSSRVSASYEDGILKVSLPKAEEAKPRQIEINVK
jgi:HSP20 family protein